MSKSRFLYSAVALLLLSSCASDSGMTPEKRQVLQTRFFSGIGEKELFELAIENLKASGYQTTTVNPEEGIVVGTMRIGDPLSTATRFGRDSHNAIRQGERFEALVNIKRVDPTNVSMRLSLQRLPEFSLGAVQGEEILDPQTYNKFFSYMQATLKKKTVEAPSTASTKTDQKEKPKPVEKLPPPAAK